MWLLAVIFLMLLPAAHQAAIGSGVLSVTLNGTNGDITSIAVGDNQYTCAGAVAFENATIGSVKVVPSTSHQTVLYTITSTTYGGSADVVLTVAPGVANQVVFTVNITGAPGTDLWSTGVDFNLRCTKIEASVWVPWSRGCDSDECMRQSPLDSVPFPKTVTSWSYGSGCAHGCWPPAASVPLIQFVDNGTDTSVALAVAPTRSLLGLDIVAEPGSDSSQQLALRTTAGLRFESGVTRQLEFSVFGGTSCPRSVLGDFVTAYPAVFEPPNNNVHYRASGLGSYSGYPGNVSALAPALNQMGYKVNWDAHFWWPYMCLLPNISRTEEWPNNAHAYARLNSSYAAIDEFLKTMQDLNFTALLYFNIAEFGQNMSGYVPPPPGQLPGDFLRATPGDWQDPRLFVQKYLDPAIPRDSRGKRQIKLVWDGDMVLDATTKEYHDYLLDQIHLRLNNLPHFMGVSCDRTVYTDSFASDDNLTTTIVDGKWVRFSSGHQAWHSVMTDVSDLLHSKDKLISYNVLTGPRVDLVPYIDYIFTEEDGGTPEDVHLVGWMGLRKPVVMWTSTLSSIDDQADLFFQRLLFMGSFPMAPFPDNDHAIGPSTRASKFFADYGSMFRALSGRQWVLRSHAVRVVNKFPSTEGTQQRPSLQLCNATDPTQQWNILQGPEGGDAVFVQSKSEHGQCLEVFSGKFTAKSCTLVGGEVTWVYPGDCPQATSELHTEPLSACPGLGNVLWKLGNNELKTPMADDFCLTAPDLTMEKCSAPEKQRFVQNNSSIIWKNESGTEYCLSTMPVTHPASLLVNVFELLDHTHAVVVASAGQPFAGSVQVALSLGARPSQLSILNPGTSTPSVLPFAWSNNQTMFNATLVRGAAVVLVQ